MPFIGLQILGMALVFFLPQVSTWLPRALF
jgi:TRAP-type C4-dicarboxylate transport system permease large subunit